MEMNVSNKNEAEVKSSDQLSTLRFEVSKHRGRIHLYNCNPRTNCRPTPLFKSFRPEEVDCRSIAEENEKTSDKPVEDNSLYMEGLMVFVQEWKDLRPIEKRKLLNKPLQLPLSNELCYLSESLNHENGGGSNRRKTPLTEIHHPLPSNATWRQVGFCAGHGQKEKLYTQAWSDKDEPLCKLCQTPCKGNNAKVPQFFEDLFCSLNCLEEYRSRTSNRFLREGLFQIEHGICTNCQVNCHQLVKHLKVLSLEKREAYIKRVAPNIARLDKLLKKLVHDPTEGNAWHADHIIPVYKGGGECKLENMRTLCVACHADVTAEQCKERRIARNNSKKQLKETLSKVLQKCNLEDQSDKLDDDLLLDIPGSAYSRANTNTSNDQNQLQENICNESGEASSVVEGEKMCQEVEDPSVPTETDVVLKKHYKLSHLKEALKDCV